MIVVNVNEMPKESNSNDTVVDETTAGFSFIAVAGTTLIITLCSDHCPLKCFRHSPSEHSEGHRTGIND